MNRLAHPRHTVFAAGFLALVLSLSLILPRTAQAVGPSEKWFVGAGFSGFELNGSGTMNTFDNSSMEFNVKRFNSYGLVTNRVNTSESSLGLGWQDSQLPGYALHVGYRHSWRFVSRLDFFWAFPKSSDKYGQSPDTPGSSSITKQSTLWHQSRVRLMVDFTPFEPLSLVFLTGGLEYTSFEARLEFFADEQQASGQLYRDYVEYVDGGSAFGVVLGAGVVLHGESKTSESYLTFTYSYSPFNSEFFAWDSNINMGGLALDAGMRFYLGGKD